MDDGSDSDSNWSCMSVDLDNPAPVKGDVEETNLQEKLRNKLASMRGQFFVSNFFF